MQSSSRLSYKRAHTKQSEPLEEFQERISKFAEIKTLLTPYLSHQEICTILQMLAIECTSSGNDYFLDQSLIKVRQTVKFRQDLDQPSSSDLPLSVNNNNNNNNMATHRASSLIGNNRFIAQNNFQICPHLSPPPLQQPQQQGQNFHPITFLVY